MPEENDDCKWCPSPFYGFVPQDAGAGVAAQWRPIALDINGFIQTDRGNGNTAKAAIASGTRTAETFVNITDNTMAKGATFLFNVSAVTATGSLTLTIEGRDPVSLGFYPILVSNAITTVSLNALRVYPGLTAVPGLTVSDMLPLNYRIRVTPVNAVNMTYSVGVLTVV